MPPAQMSPAIGVLLVDDEDMVRSGLSMLLDAEPDIVVVGEAADATAAVELTARLRPRVVVMDVRMPGTDDVNGMSGVGVMDGIAATRVLTSEHFVDGDGDMVTVLILTGFTDDDAVHAALRAGASGFILKSSAPRVLCDAVRALAGGGGWLDSRVIPTLLSDIAHRSDPALPRPDRLRLLTRREREVLVAVSHGLSTREAADYLVLSEATVKTHLHRIFHKLGVSERAQAVAIAYKTGLVKAEDHL